MKQILVALLGLVFLHSPSTAANLRQVIFTYEVHGGHIGTDQIVVKLTDDHKLSYSSVGLPITKHGATKRSASKVLSSEEEKQLVRAAVNAQDFVNNPEDLYPDFRWAMMSVVDKRVKIQRQSGPLRNEWHLQPGTKALLAELERHFPDELRNHLP